jgi:hypothetical protein
VLVASFGVFGSTARTARVAAAERPAVELAARSEFRVRRASAPIGFDAPASPLVLTSAVRVVLAADWADHS